MSEQKITSLTIEQYADYYVVALRELDKGIPVEGIVDDFMLLGWERELAEQVAYDAFQKDKKESNFNALLLVFIGLPLTIIGFVILIYALQNGLRSLKLLAIPFVLGLTLLSRGLVLKYNR